MDRMARVILAGLVAVAFWATCLDPAYATRPGNGRYKKDGDRTSIEVDITAASHPQGNVYLLGPAFRSADINFDFGASFVGELFVCDIEDADATNDGTVDASAGCVSVTALTADTTLTDARMSRRFLVLDVNTSESGSTISRLTIFGSFTVGGGGGVLGSGPLADMLAYPDPKAGDLWQQTDDNGTGDCGTAGGVGSALMCQWNDASAAWVPAGLAGGTDNLGNHTATTILDLAGNAIENIGGFFNYTPETWTGVIPDAGTNTGRFSSDVWQAGDGTKDTGNKSTIVGWLRRIFHLTEGENYGDMVRVWCGADSDCIGTFLMAWASGGSQTEGDEGVQGIRASAYDGYGSVFGDLDTAIAAGAGTTSVNISNVPQSEARSLGENKLIVFNAVASAVDVDIVTLPAGVMNDAFAVPDASWSTTPSPTQGVWQLGSGEVASSGVNVGWCFKADASDYTSGWDATAGRAWLYVTAINSGADTITTEWISQGIDYKVPYGYRGQAGTDTGRVAPCGKLGRPTLDATFAATATSVITGAGFPGVADTATFEVAPYPGITAAYGVTARVGKMFGGPSINSSYAFMGMNSMAGGIGRYQISALLDAQYSGSLGSMIDGNYHAFGAGLKCGTGDCEVGMAYNWLNNDNRAWPIELDAGSTEFGTNDEPHVVIRMLDAGTSNAGNTSLNITIDKTDGWGMNSDPFITSARTQTISGAKTFSGANSFTGTNDFTTGRLRARDDATCSDNNLGGELCVQGPGSLFVEGVEISSGGSGDVTAVGNCTSGSCFTSGGTGTAIQSDSTFSIEIDADDSSAFGTTFQVLNGTGGALMTITEAATVATSGLLVPTTVQFTNASVLLGESLTTRGAMGFVGGDAAAGLPVNTYRILAPLTGSANIDVYLPNDLPDAGNECLQISSTGQISATGGACGSASFFADAGGAIVPADGHDVIVGGDEDDVCEANEICLGQSDGVIIAEGLVIRDQVSGSNYREFDDNPTTVPSAPSGDNVRLYTTDDGELYKKDADDGAGDGVRLMTAQDFRRYPFFFTDFIAPNANATTSSSDPANSLWDTTAIASGTVSYQAGTAHHPGWWNMLSVLNTANSGIAINTHTTSLTLAGGETFEAIFQLVPASGATLTGANLRLGFLDTAAVGEAVDGVYIKFAGSLTPTCESITSTGGAATSTAFTNPISSATWYRGVVSTNADASEVYCSLYTDGSDAPIQTITINTAADIPTGQTTGTGIVAYTTDGASAAHTVARVDWLSLGFTRRLNR